ncbi:hypothetical protein [Promicromonospora sp. NPDC090134]|uniref:hypothetical protein n=1 Tax=Promicromonospora sp. NPDC090134 TaxID=3364408 RepID=UPI0037FCD91E
MNQNTPPRGVVAVAVAGLLAALWLIAPAAHAAPAAPAEPSAPDQTPIVCTGSVTVTYTPPLGPLPRLTAQEVVERPGATGGGSCTGPFSGAVATTVFEQEVGCLLQGLGDTLVENVVTYQWQGGRSSVITYSATTVLHLANQLVVTSTGTVTGGYREGALSERVAVYADLDVLACLSSGVDQQTGLLTLTIT